MLIDKITQRQINQSQRSLEQMELAWGRYSRRLIPDMQNLADLLFAVGQYKEAEAICLRLLSVMTKNHGYDHPAVAAALQMLGEVCELQNFPIESERYYLWALEVRMRCKTDDGELTEILARLANLYRAQKHSLKSKAIETRLLQVLSSPPAQAAAS